MANFYRATVTIQADSALPADAVVNTWAFLDDNDNDRDDIALDIRTRLLAFYGDFKDYYSSAFDLTTMALKIYDMDEAQPRFPYYDENMSPGAGSSSQHDWPREVAIVLSFQGARTSGVNMRRRRGRVFLGPFSMPAGDLDTVGSAFITQVTDSAETNLLSPVGSICDWAVYSFYQHHNVPVGEAYNPDTMPEDPAQLGNAFTRVTRLWMDDAWDTQRRRGRKATTRTVIDA